MPTAVGLMLLATLSLLVFFSKEKNRELGESKEISIPSSTAESIPQCKEGEELRFSPITGGLMCRVAYKELFPPPRRVDLKFREQNCSVSSEGILGEPNERPIEFRLILNCDGQSQELWSLHSSGLWDDPSFSVELVGDWDQDGKMDILVRTMPKYSWVYDALYLSKGADQGQLVHRVASNEDAYQFILKQIIDQEDPKFQMALAFYERARSCIQIIDEPCLNELFVDEIHFPYNDHYGCELNDESVAAPRKTYLMTKNELIACLNSPRYRLRRDLLGCFNDKYKLLNVRHLMNPSANLVSETLNYICFIERDEAAKETWKFSPSVIGSLP